MLQEIYSDLYKKLTEKYLNTDVRSLALNKNSLKGIDSQLFIEQMALLQRSKNKLPTYFEQRCLFTSKSLQQASSEAVAKFRASLFSGKRCIDLTGGLGVDDFAFSFHFGEVIGIDPDEQLNEITRINFEKLNCNNISRLNGKAEDLWSQLPEADLVFADPDRRPDNNQRKHSLAQMEPDIAQLYPKLNQKYAKILTKISPLFDVREIPRFFHNVSDIWCIALKNEMKEVCFLINSDHSQKSTQLHAVNLTDTKNFIYSETLSEQAPSSVLISLPLPYFFEPDHALIHSGLWKQLAYQNNFKIFHPSTPLLFSENLIINHSGRCFQTSAAFPYKNEVFKKYIEQSGIRSANLSHRGSGKLDPDLIFKKFKLRQGGSDYFFFPESADGTQWFIHGIKT